MNGSNQIRFDRQLFHIFPDEVCSTSSYQEGRLILNLTLQLKNNEDGRLQALISKIDGFREISKLFQLPIDVYLREIDASHTNISGNLFSHLFWPSPQEPIFLGIKKLNLSHTKIKATDLNQLKILNQLEEIKLDYCKDLYLFEKSEETICPSVKTISVIGSSLTVDFNWLPNIEAKFPNFVRIDFRQHDGCLNCAITDMDSSDEIKFPQVYSPCGHVFDIAKRLEDWVRNECRYCKQPLQEYFEADFQINRLEKIGEKWRIDPLDFKSYPILESDDNQLQCSQRRDHTYFHPGCHQIFTGKAVSELLKKQEIIVHTNQEILDQSQKILCPACPNPTHLKLMRIYLNLTTDSKKREFKSLKDFQNHRLLSYFE